MKPKTRETPEEWVSRSRRYDGTTGRPGPRDVGYTPYVRIIHAFFDNLADSARGAVKRFAWASKYETLVFITGTQSGKTDSALDIIGWRQSTRPRPTLFVGPSKDFVSEIVEDRLTKMLTGSKGLRIDLLNSTKRLKIVNGVRVRLGWGGSPSSLASDQAGDIIVDEYDKMFRAQRRAGDPYVLAKARGDTYADRKMLVTSTPEQGRVETEVDPETGIEYFKVGDPEGIESRIWRRFQTGTRHHAAWQCPHCVSWFVPMMKHLSWPKGAAAGDMLASTELICPQCGSGISESHKDAMNENVQFIAPGQRLTTDGKLEGEPVNTDVLTVWVSGLMSPFVTWGKRAAELRSAELSGEPEAIQGAMNKAGECWSPVSVKEVGLDHLQSKKLNYVFGQVPGEVLRVTLGADVQGNRILYVVRGWGARGRSWLLDRGEVMGKTSDLEVWSRFALIYQNRYDGLRIEKGIIDAGFRPDKREAGDYHRVLDHCHTHSWVVQASRGKARQSVPLIRRYEEVTADGRSDKFGLEVLSVDSDYFKSQWFSRLLVPTMQPGAAHFPTDIDDDYAKQIVSEVRGDDGVWHQVFRQNHYLDCESLAGVAAYMLEVNHIPEGSYRSLETGDIVKPGTQSIQAESMSVKDRMAKMSARFNRTGK